MSNIRVERIGKFIKQRVSQIILRDLQDPRVGFITVTKVKVASDLKNALVYVSVLGTPADRSKCWHALQQARGFIQRAVADDLDTYVTPEIQFRYDESIEGAVRISRLVDEAVADSSQPDGSDVEAEDVDEDTEVDGESEGDDES